MDTNQNESIVSFRSRAEWAAWLAAEHAFSDGVWLKLAKKGATEQTVSRADALDVALCYGWIDSQLKPFDAEYWLQRFTPRRPRSKWSRINRDRVTQLIEQSRMQPAGLREVERAKADGRWDAAYEGQRAATVPDDLALALADNEEAQAFFQTLTSVNRYAILYRIQDAKRPQTRAQRIAKFVKMLAEHKTIYP
jgi:uncharacterized protein YdeI (YjbR/CyaY-like superfamily)